MKLLSLKNNSSNTLCQGYKYDVLAMIINPLIFALSTVVSKTLDAFTINITHSVKGSFA